MIACSARQKKSSRRGEKIGKDVVNPKLLLYVSLLRWHVEDEEVIKFKAIYCKIDDYQGTKIFTWFVEQVTEARRIGDVDKSKALLAKVF